MTPSRNKLLDDTFHVGITLKGIDGVLEIMGGVLLWFITPAAMSSMLQMLCAHELSRDPNDFIAAHFLHASMKLANTTPMFASLYLLSHGLTKVVLVISLWLNKLWAYPLTIYVLVAFCVYQVYRFNHTHSITLVLLTVFDLFLIYLTWREYLEQKSIRGLN